MDLRQKLLSILASTVVLVIVLELVRRRKLTEELSWVWLLAGVVIFLCAVWDNLFAVITRFTGIIAPTSIVFFFGILFLLMASIHLSITVTRLKSDVKNLGQALALLEQRKEEAP